MVRNKASAQKAADLRSAGDQFSVKTICQLTGLNEHTLRAWERRYQVVNPSRLENGRRVYSVADLEKIKLVTLLVRKGFLIGNIAQSSQAELSALVHDSSPVFVLEDARRARSGEFLGSLKLTVAGYELMKVQSLLQQARVEYGIRDFLLEIVLPFIGHIGEAVEKGEFGIGQEHAWSSILRSELMQILYLLTQSHSLMRVHESAKTFAVANNQNNQHEFGALISAVLCAYHGYPTFYFGPNLPAAALADAALAVGANTIIVGLPITQAMPDDTLEQWMDELKSHKPKVCEIWVGGVATKAMLQDKSIHALLSLSELDRLLASIKKV